MATFIIANGAAAMGGPVTIFFTFWGLNVLRKPNGPAVAKGFLDKMFGMMMPKGARRLRLSKLNMGGVGTMLMKHVMRSKNVMDLPTLIKAAQDAGVRLIACAMSMDVMGIAKEELIDGVEVAGVANYLGTAETSSVNLFI
jgi:peroxiredoxin family protein